MAIYPKTSYGFKRNQRARRSIAAKRVQRRPRKQVVARPHATIIKNVKAITTLQNQVNGHVQKNWMVADFTPNTSYALQPLQPIAMILNDFTDKNLSNSTGGQIFGAIYTGVAPNIQPSAAIIGNWALRNPGLVSGLAPQYHQWKDQNNDKASLKAYQPLYAEYSLTFNRAEQAALQQDIYVRIDTVRSRRRYLPSNFNNYVLPDCLGALSNMANKNDPKTQNCYNPALWNVKTKYIKLPQMDVTRNNHSVTHRFRMGFPKKLLRLNLDQPFSGTGTDYEPFHLANDPKDNIWCIVNISDVQGAGTKPVETVFTRKVVYRDQRGVSM